MGCVYLITSPSGKQYVGMTARSFNERWKQHCWAARDGSRLHLHRAIRKHGAESFETTILAESDSDEELKSLEIAKIKELGTLSPKGYNLTKGGDGVRACEELNVRNSVTKKAQRADPSSAYNRPQWRELMSRASRANWDDPNSVVNSKEYREKSRRSKQRRFPNLFCEGAIFRSMREAGRNLAMDYVRIHALVHSDDPRWRWWHTIPNHNDPECDAVEECWAIMQWAEANPDHENVPAWVRRRA